MVDFINDHKIVPVIDEVFEMDNAEKAFAKMAHSTQFGKIVLKIA
jgi:zinc-binding alcohol dehydrogenase/oxidoreductase